MKTTMKKSLTLLFFICTCSLFAQITIFPNGSTWKYKDDGSNQGTAWQGTTFNDATWSTGVSQFGYGDGDEATIVNACGTVVQFPSCSNKYITTYFRKTINVPSTASYTAYTINFRRDDAIIVYFNGNEVYRNGLPAGTITHTTIAPSACADDGNTTFSVLLSPTVITTGTNVIAVEIHQNGGSSSDVSFEFNLVGNTSYVIPTIVKGPYLQVGTQSSMVVRWETNVATDSKVMYGTNAASLSSVASNSVSSVTHTVQLSGLTPYTKYYYNIGSSTLITQGDTNNYFLTSPIPGTPGKYRFWMVGDCGNASSNQVNCKNQYKIYNGNAITNGMLLSGDNAYSSGTDAEFNAEFFGIYQNDVLKNMPLWPAPGNHDYNNGASTATTVPYFNHFTTPKNGEAGGVASNNPAYYSYDYGNIHFISLDSYGTTGASQKMYDTTGAQVIWLKADLAANNKKWTIVYWHHPPYTMGSHNSDTEGDLVSIRQNFIRILERNKVDMIITGHSHDYERSKLMNGHYGNEASFNAGTHNLSSSSGMYDGSNNSCPYIKDSTVNRIGTVYVVSGSAGQLGGQQGAFPHNAMHYSNATNGGSFILDIEDNKLDAKWLCADGVIRDQFTMVKEVKKVQSYTVQPNQSTTLTASWPGAYLWNNAATSRTLSASSASNATFWVKDPNNCITDTFKLKVLPSVSFSATLPYCATNPIQFTDGSTNNANVWSWVVSPSVNVSVSNANVQNPTITFANAGTYTVSLVSENSYGAGTTFSQVIIINANPIVSISSSTYTICANQSLSLTASGASTYSWNTGALANSIIASPTITTTYSLLGTDVNGCSASDSKTITVNPLPNVTAISNPSSGIVCAGGTLSLIGSGANTYSWSNSVINGAVFTPTSNLTYTLIGTDANGCQNTATKNTTINPLPSLTVAVNPLSAIVCSGSTLNLTANGATSYTWSNGITNALAFTPTISATYTVSGTLNGCQNTITQTVIVNALPTVTTTTVNAICAGQTATLTANGANAYLWNTNASSSSIVVSPTITTTYTVVGTGTNSCQNSSIRTLTVNALPIISAISNPTNGIICAGNSLTLNGSGASTYTWSNGVTNATAFTPTSNTTYTLTGTDANGCQNVAITSVTVNSNPTLTINAGTVICSGQSTSLSVSGASSYLWNNNAANATITVSPSSTTTYSVVGTATNGCTGVASQAIVVNPLPTITVNSGAICPGFSFSLNPSGANTYSYSAGSNVVSPITTTSYSVIGTSSLGCISAQAAIATVSVVNSLTVSISGTTSVCSGQTINLTANGASTYTWNNGAVSNAISPAPTANTSYTVTGGSGSCTNTAVFSVSVNPLPSVSIASNHTLICAGETASLTATGATTYSWTNSQSFSVIAITPSVTTTYSLIGFDANNCSNTAAFTQSVSECTAIRLNGLLNSINVYPNPNNGVFNIDLTAKGNFSVELYNTLGQKVYTEKIQTGLNTISLDVMKGIYFFSILENKELLSTGKIIVE